MCTQNCIQYNFHFYLYYWLLDSRKNNKFLNQGYIYTVLTCSEVMKVQESQETEVTWDPGSAVQEQGCDDLELVQGTTEQRQDPEQNMTSFNNVILLRMESKNRFSFIIVSQIIISMELFGVTTMSSDSLSMI